MPQASFFLAKALYNMTMIRLAQIDDLKVIQDLCAIDRYRLLFIDGDIAQNGLHTAYQQTWIDVENDEIRGLFLRYHRNLLLYFKKPLNDHHGFEALLDEHIKMISACKRDIDQLPQAIKDRFSFRTMTLCACDELTSVELRFHPRLVKPQDSALIVESLNQIEEFQAMQTQDSKENRINTMFDRITLKKIHGFMIEENQKVIAHAATTVETTSAVMIGAVFTLPEYRNQSYGRAVIYAITKCALDKGQKPCLFYDNPKAGKTYHDLRYVTFDQWCLGSLKP